MPPLDITIRAIEPSDADDWWALRNAPTSQAQTMGLPYFSREQARQMLANPPENFCALAAVVDGHVVGACSLRLGYGRKRHSGHLDISVRDDYAGRGIGTALMAAVIDLAENWLGLTRLELQVYTDNARAIHLYEKFGFEIEGTMRRQALRNGAYVDAHFMARIKE